MIFERKANHNKFFNDFCKVQAQNLKTFAEGFQVVIYFYPCIRGQRHLLIVALDHGPWF